MKQIEDFKQSLIQSGYSEEMAETISRQMFGDFMKEGNK